MNAPIDNGKAQELRGEINAILANIGTITRGNAQAWAEIDKLHAAIDAAFAHPAAQPASGGEAVWRSAECVDPMCACRGGPCAECPEGDAIAFAVTQTEAVAEESTYGVGLIKFCAPTTALKYLAKRLRKSGISSAVADDYAQSIEFLIARCDDLGAALAATPSPAAPAAQSGQGGEAWHEQEDPQCRDGGAACIDCLCSGGCMSAPAALAAPAQAVQAKPLTAAQIEAGRCEFGGERFDFTAGVRFAERAHGIGDTK